jgi:hypothetical protein
MWLSFKKFFVIFLIISLLIIPNTTQAAKRRRGRPKKITRTTTIIKKITSPTRPIPDSILDKLVTWERGKYRDILNRNGIPTKQYKGGIYIEKIRYGKATYSPVHKVVGTPVSNVVIQRSS